jgi:hypothetical protein
MIRSYDRAELVARFRPRPFSAAADDASHKPPIPTWFDELGDSGLAIKSIDFNRIPDGQTSQTTHTTKFERIDKRDLDGFPDEWRAIAGELGGSTPIDGFGDARWQLLVDDTEIFLLKWGKAAHLLGWTAIDLFGVHPAAPAVRFDVMGLLPLLGGASVVALTTDEARMLRPSKAMLTFRRANQEGAVLVTRCRQ